jgi:transcription antitermination factor NusG
MRQRIILRWYVARVKRQTENKIKQYLEQSGIEHCIPIEDGTPVIPSLIFVRTDYNHALSIREDSGMYISYLPDNETHGFLVIPDSEMERFLFLQRFAGKYYFLPNPENLQGGEKVRVTGGEYAGIEGELYRLKGHKRVVVKLGNLVSVAMNEYIAKENLERIKN